MTTPPLSHPPPIQMAKITCNASQGKSWLCPNCGQRLADIIGRRVVIKVQDRQISLPADVEQDQVCWKCGTTSYLNQGRAA